MPPPQHSESIVPWVALGISILSILVSVTGWFVVHSLAVRRDRASGKINRKRLFAAFLSEWKAATVQGWPPKENKGQELHREAALVRNDFSDPDQFDALISAAFALTGAGTETKDARQRTLEALDRLVAYVNGA